MNQNSDFRREIYEDYSFPLRSISNDTTHLQGFDLHSLRNYVKISGNIFLLTRIILIIIFF